MKTITIKDIAKECNVSLSTVSLVLNNNPRISDATRERVQAAVKKNHYQPNNNARGLASRSSHTVSVVVPHLGHVFADPYFGEIISGIYEQASDDGYKVLLDVANEKFITNGEYMGLLRARRADGMLYIGGTTTDTFPMEFENIDLPFVLVNHHYPNITLNEVSMDYTDSGRLAAEHLAGFGHRHIGLIEGTNTHTGRELSRSFIANCEKMGIPSFQVYPIDAGGDWNQESGYMAIQNLMVQHPEITAIMASNDRMALGAMTYLNEKGLRVPEDVSVMGVDDIERAAFAKPSLSTIFHDLYDLGRLSFRRMLAIYKKEITRCQDRKPVTLMARNSTGPARS